MDIPYESGPVKTASVTNSCNGHLAAHRVPARYGPTEAEETAREYASGCDAHRRQAQASRRRRPPAANRSESRMRANFLLTVLISAAVTRAQANQPWSMSSRAWELTRHPVAIRTR